MTKSGYFPCFSVFYSPFSLRGSPRVGVFHVFYVNLVKTVIFGRPLAWAKGKVSFSGKLTKPGLLKTRILVNFLVLDTKESYLKSKVQRILGQMSKLTKLTELSVIGPRVNRNDRNRHRL